MVTLDPYFALNSNGGFSLNLPVRHLRSENLDGWSRPKADIT